MEYFATSITEKIADWSIEVMESLGGVGAAILIAVENIFPPLPSEIILPLAGFTASRGELGLLEVIVWTTIGSLVGAIALYYIGALFGRERLRKIIVKLPLVRIEDVDKTEKWFQKHSTATVFWGRMIPIFRSLISIPAGIERMNMTKFVLFTTAGSLIWNTVLILAGYLLGENWHIVEEYVSWFQYLVLFSCLVLLFLYVKNRLKPETSN